jgi:hypothetical protein
MNPGGHVNRPESTANEAALSTDVQTTTPFWTWAPDLPTIKPLIVTVTLDAGRVAESVVMISTPRFVGVNDNLSPVTLEASVETKGTTPSSKKLRGYASVTVPRGGMGLVDVNDNVSDTLDFIEIRSEDDMAKETDAT